MKSQTILFLFFIFFAFSFLTSADKAKAQGCSDAGFCTIHSLKPDEQNGDLLQNNLSAGISYGKGENGINVVSPYLEYTRNINKNFSITGKFLYSAVKGDIGSVSGAADGFISVNNSIGAGTGLTLGLKIPFTDGNSTINSIPLPMAYQVSLGTLDIIAGINHSHENFQFMAAFQQPLSQNKNQFFTDLYPAGSDAKNYQTTNNYKRSGDVLVRASYTFSAGNGSFKIIPAILPIYHLSDDKFTDRTGIEYSIEGSQGLTLNGNLFLVYSIDRKNAVELSFGAPVKSRTSRPDGLTRKFAVSLEYKASF
ncbi:MAG: hypothetical protein JST55_12545 [Bacteroidetes bacterium]|nr:hypothetical protein [Bacteroidota bacterium]